MKHKEARILVVGDNAVDAEQVCNMLRDRYPYVEATTDPMASDAVFDGLKPQLLVLGHQNQSFVLAHLPSANTLLLTNQNLTLFVLPSSVPDLLFLSVPCP